jgi:uncharacterized repeat protein (TIGR02543 family)
MASVSFTRTSETTIYYYIAGANSGGAYTYQVQVKSNTSGNWITKATVSVPSSGTATGTISVNDNSSYYVRVAETYNSSGDTTVKYYPTSSGRLVESYSPGYSGTIILYDEGGYNYDQRYPYQGYVKVRVTLSAGAGSGWFIRVNSSAANTTYISSSGVYTITLDNLYDGATGTLYRIYLYDPGGVQQDYIGVAHRNTPYVTHYLFFDANGGSGGPDYVSETVVACYDPYSLGIPRTEPTREGYDFLGWSKSSGATAASYSPGGSVSVSGSLTLYAVWKSSLSVTEPNVTSLSITGVSASGFTVTAKQDNLQAGSWGIQISTSSNFSNIVATSTQALASTRSLTHEFTGLLANTLYYVRVFNVYGGKYAYAGTWSRRTGIAPFSWAKTPAAGDAPSAAITAAKWNQLQEKISQVSVRNGSGSVAADTVYAEERIMAADFNSVRAKLAALSGAGSLPGTKQKGDPLLAADFEGTASLKGAINRAIAALNN